MSMLILFPQFFSQSFSEKDLPTLVNVESPTGGWWCVELWCIRPLLPSLVECVTIAAAEI